MKNKFCRFSKQTKRATRKNCYKVGILQKYTIKEVKHFKRRPFIRENPFLYNKGPIRISTLYAHYFFFN